jgi:hypothetical protein
MNTMSLHVLYPKGYTSAIHMSIIDELNKWKQFYGASCYFKVSNLERIEGGFDLSYIDRPYAKEDYATRL